MDGLREEADRIQAELAAAGQEWLEWTIARERVGTVLSAPGGCTADAVAAERPGGAGTEAVVQASMPVAAKAKSQVPVWRKGLAVTALSADYQRILAALADRVRLGQGPPTCQEMASAFGMERVPAKVEALRSKAKRLVARGWPAEPAPGRFTLARSVSGQGGGS